MPENQNNQQYDIREDQWKSIYTLGGITSIIVLIGVFLDIVVGTISGGNLSALPQTAIDRFNQFSKTPLFGLYNLDLLNVINQTFLIPTYFALYAAHRKIRDSYSLLALIVFLVGTTVFITTNTALPMFELSKKYELAQSETQKTLLAAAGEAMLARGAHGSTGVFIGFLLPNIAGIIMSLTMLKGKIFNKTTAYLGIFGSILISLYIVSVTFIPTIKNLATAFSMPGGLLLTAWMILFTIKLLKLGNSKT